MSRKRAGIIGGTGYIGVELLRILSAHPDIEVVVVSSRSEAGRAVADEFPSLRGRLDLAFCDPGKADWSNCNVVFSAAANGVAMTHAGRILEQGAKFIDLSADFRISDPAVWETWYGMPHACPELIAEAVYGLTEINRETIKRAYLLANPGCYPTAVQLGYLPLIERGLIDLHTLIADAKSGVSGAGRKASVATAFGEVADSFKAYSASGHRHLPEIRQGLEMLAQSAVGLVFTPHLLPIIRGIHATLYAKLNNAGQKLALTELQTIFEERFRDELFVDVLTLGAHPETRSVRGSNLCRLAVHRPQDGDTAVVLAVIDNLVKGAAGQAVQNMNLMLGLDEGAGLAGAALTP